MKQRVLLAMSGGVDSSVAALLLKKQGYEVIGAFMKCFSDTKNPLTGECNWRAERRMAMKIASLLDISFVTLDFEKEYKKYVVNEMFKIYRKGITPNPDVDCNNKVKFPLLWKAAKKMKCELIATGHYVRVKKVSPNRVRYPTIRLPNHPPESLLNKSELNYEKNIDGKKINNNLQNLNNNYKKDLVINFKSAKKPDKVGFGANKNASLRAQNNKPIYKLLRGKDELKDQSYFLYRLMQKDLAHTLFPIGELTKVEVREIARKNNFPNYDKKGTTGICFIGNIDTKKFLKRKIKPKKGKLLDVGGNVIGEHDGVYFYTIGERIGPRHGINFEKFGDDKRNVKKWYVARKNLKRNEIVLAPEGHELNFRKEIVVKDLHLINDNLSEAVSIASNSRPHSATIAHRNPNVKSLTTPSHPPSRRQKGIAKQPLKLPFKVNVRIRHVGELLPAIVKGKKIVLRKAITGVSEGQAIVFYKGEVCVGGGVIGF